MCHIPIYTFIEKSPSLRPHADYDIFMLLINLGLSQQKWGREECVAMQGRGEGWLQPDMEAESKGRADIKDGKAKWSQIMERSDFRISDCIMFDVVDPHYSWIMCL